MRSITNCNANLTAPCPPAPTRNMAPASTVRWTASLQRRQHAPPPRRLRQHLSDHLQGRESPRHLPLITYAGGTPLTNLLTVESYALFNGEFGAAFNSNSANPAPDPALLKSTSCLWSTAAPTSAAATRHHQYPAGRHLGDSGDAANGRLVIRPTAAMADLNGAVWYSDNHYP